MAATMSDSPLSVASGMDRNQFSPSSNHKRTHRNRKPRQQPAAPSDGVLSESALNPTSSPRSKKARKAKQSPATNTIPVQQTPGKSPVMRQRPVSMNQSGVDSPLKEQAYAGPTFQSSPAASALPMPKFFSRSVPSGVGKPSLQGRMAGEKSPETSSSSPETDSAQLSLPARDAQQSPLDVFFNADRAERAEREKTRIANEHKSTLTAQASHIYAADGRSFFGVQSGDGMRSSELSGEQGRSRTDGSRSQIPPAPVANGNVPFSKIKVPPPNSGDEERHAYTQSLKDLLFSTTAPQASTPPSRQDGSVFGSQTPESVYFTPSPDQRSSSGPTTPQNPFENLNNNSFHYGNRNLSPLFKAARSETPSRPSSLRQEVSCDGKSTADSAVDINSPPPIAAHHSPQYHHQIPTQQTTRPDWRSHTPGYAAYQPRDPLPNSIPYSTSYASGTSNGAWNASGPPLSPRTGESNDIKNMEDDLRRMLKLNALS